MTEDNKKRQENGKNEVSERVMEHSEQRMYNLMPNPDGDAAGFSPEFFDRITTPNKPTTPIKETESE